MILPSKKLLIRYLIFVSGLFLMSIGIALSVQADMGISPISSLPYVLSLGMPISLGLLTIILHTGFLAGEIIILKREFYLLSLLQIPVTIVFGMFIDVACMLCSWIVPQSYLMQWVVLIASCVILAIGICLQITPHVFVMASEGLMLAAFQKYGIPLEQSKIAIDVTLVTLGIIYSFAAFSTLLGIREGTVASAILIGLFVRQFKKPVERVVKLVTGTI